MATTGLNRWKVIKSEDYMPGITKFFFSDKDLLEYLEEVLESYEDEGYCDYNGGNLDQMIKQTIRVGNEKEEADGTGITHIIKL